MSHSLSRFWRTGSRTGTRNPCYHPAAAEIGIAERPTTASTERYMAVLPWSLSARSSSTTLRTDTRCGRRHPMRCWGQSNWNRAESAVQHDLANSSPRGNSTGSSFVHGVPEALRRIMECGESFGVRVLEQARAERGIDCSGSLFHPPVTRRKFSLPAARRRSEPRALATARCRTSANTGPRCFRVQIVVPDHLVAADREEQVLHLARLSFILPRGWSSRSTPYDQSGIENPPPMS